MLSHYKHHSTEKCKKKQSDDPKITPRKMKNLREAFGSHVKWVFKKTTIHLWGRGDRPCWRCPGIVKGGTIVYQYPTPGGGFSKIDIFKRGKKIGIIRPAPLYQSKAIIAQINLLLERN